MNCRIIHITKVLLVNNIALLSTDTTNNPQIDAYCFRLTLWSSPSPKVLHKRSGLDNHTHTILRQYITISPLTSLTTAKVHKHLVPLDQHATLRS
jgi:hypothetical protein